MTIILAIGNHQQVIQFSDRRLSATGLIVNDHSNKATSFTCGNGRFAVGYTGLASHRSFHLQTWLVDSLSTCAPPEFGVMETCERICSRLTELFKTHPDIRDLSPNVKRLTVFLSGYLYRPDRPYIGNVWITNYQDLESGSDFLDAKPEFWIAAALEKEDSIHPVAFIQRTGAWPAMLSSDEAVLTELLEKEAEENTLVDATVGLIRRMATRPAAANTIGYEVAAITIPRDPSQPITSRVRLASGSDSWIGVDQVVALPDPVGSVAIRGLRLEVSRTTDQGPAFQPKLGRNDRCWCKSGLKFKHCHGKPNGRCGPAG